MEKSPKKHNDFRTYLVTLAGASVAAATGLAVLIAGINHDVEVTTRDNDVRLTTYPSPEPK